MTMETWRSEPSSFVRVSMGSVVFQIPESCSATWLIGEPVTNSFPECSRVSPADAIMAAPLKATAAAKQILRILSIGGLPCFWCESGVLSPKRSVVISLHSIADDYFLSCIENSAQHLNRIAPSKQFLYGMGVQQLRISVLSGYWQTVKWIDLETLMFLNRFIGYRIFGTGMVSRNDRWGIYT